MLGRMAMIKTYFTLNLLDLALTTLILELGGYERNPFLSSCLDRGGFLLMASVKMAIVLACTMILETVKHLLPARYKGWALVFSLPVTILIAVVCAQNVGVLWELGLWGA